MENPVISPSALKHGIPEEDMLHAFRNPMRAWDLDEGFLMISGPDRSGNLLEVGYIRSNANIVILHAMRARRKFLR
ncbi:hypothetical protein [uncultured Corynebacterium sp.]|uniref:hypothetical protein n=1 Tax=uncultured Corynebacterium sp. TaxID=159447 RepID=UPI0025EE74F2|nr:hypothetical protein [uncultured Corynebacterium sp.]